MRPLYWVHAGATMLPDAAVLPRRHTSEINTPFGPHLEDEITVSGIRIETNNTEKKPHEFVHLTCSLSYNIKAESARLV